MSLRTTAGGKAAAQHFTEHTPAPAATHTLHTDVSMDTGWGGWRPTYTIPSVTHTLALSATGAGTQVCLWTQLHFIELTHNCVYRHRSTHTQGSPTSFLHSTGTQAH
jgi:hypothetical protein